MSAWNIGFASARFLSLFSAIALTCSSAALAAGGGPKLSESKPLSPATRYSGDSPIDLTNGIPFNNGTFGLPNEEYEAWRDAPTVVPGMSEKTYAFESKATFVQAMEESAVFIEHAIWNWERTSSETLPEAAEYSKNAAETMRPLLKNYRDTIKKVSKAGRSDWDQMQAEGRRAVSNLRGTYSQLHKNVSRR
jgi:hypothetical protein